MYIGCIPIANDRDIEELEYVICRLLRCSQGKCAALHTESFVQFRAKLFQETIRGISNEGIVYMPEGLVVRIVGLGVELLWVYADVTETLSTLAQKRSRVYAEVTDTLSTFT
jgi:hypothetical protein